MNRAKPTPERVEPATAGEAAFESYLSQQGKTWKKDEAFGRKKPDYLVTSRERDVLCEIKDLDESDMDKAAVKAGLQAMRPFLKDDDEYTRRVDEKLKSLQNIEACTGGAWDPFPRLQELLAEAGKQLRPAKGKLPCAVIIYNNGHSK